MKRRPFVMFLALLLATTSAPVVAMQTGPNGRVAAALEILETKDRQEIVAKLSGALRKRYVFPDIGARAATKIDAALAASDYNGLADPVAFAARLSADVTAVDEVPWPRYAGRRRI